jgi:hypothetical protein
MLKGLALAGSSGTITVSMAAATMALRVPSATAIKTSLGGSGRLSAVTTSQSSSRAGAIAEATMTLESKAGNIAKSPN